MSQGMLDFIKLISKEKDLDERTVADAMEQAIITASKKDFEQYRKIRPVIDLETGEYHVYVTKQVMGEAVTKPKFQIAPADAEKLLKKEVQIGEEIEVEIEASEFGRIAAQAARQVVYQRLRDAEKDKVYNDYKSRVGELLTGIVSRFEKGDTYLSIGKTEAILPFKEVPKGAKYKYGDRLKAVIINVKRNTKGPQVVLSRTIPKLIEQLFVQEVPEISEGIVEIVNVAREPGIRSKIAVYSHNSDVDPVGACVGMKGSRVQMIVSELESEKIDIVPYNEDPEKFIASALNPAKVLGMILRKNDNLAIVKVSKENLSLAIGKQGVNARLAVKLTGWKIDIKCEDDEKHKVTDIDEEIRRRYLEDFLNQIPGLNSNLIAKIAATDINSVEKLSHADIENFTAIEGIGEELAESIISGANEYMEALREMNEEESEKNKVQEEEIKEEK